MATDSCTIKLNEVNGNKPYTMTLDDDPLVSKLIEATLGIPNVSFYETRAMLKEPQAFAPKAVFVDIHLPDGSGLEAIPTLRQHWPYVPIIVITADPDEAKISEALSLGADDFIEKPIKPTELKARLNKRWQDISEKQSSSLVHFEDIDLDVAHALLKGPEGNRNLSPTELNLLSRLIQSQGTPVSRAELKYHCWQQVIVTENALDRKIYETRKALTDVGSILAIHTLYGEGFQLAMRKISE